MENNYVICGEADGMTVKEYLIKTLKLSTGHIKTLKYTLDGITVNGERKKVSHILNRGDLLKLSYEDKSNVKASCGELRTVYLDDFIRISIKAHGVAIHPDKDRSTDTFANLLAYEEKGAVHIVTRLDKATGGLVLSARDKVTAQKLVAMTKERSIGKTYYAVCKGQTPLSAVIEEPLLRNAEKGKTVISDLGKYACTVLTTEETSNGYSLVKLYPRTGRTHQLRAHLCHIGFPIVGDDLYGGEENSAMLLHMAELKFTHPVTGNPVCAYDDPDFENFGFGFKSISALKNKKTES